MYCTKFDTKPRKEKKMLSKTNKNRLFSLLALLSLNTMGSSLIAGDCCDPCECNRFYIGAFGGGIYSEPTHVSQQGTAFFTEAEGGPLAVYAHGKTKESSGALGGIQIGYEWLQCPISFGCGDWTITPGAEVEAYWYNHTKKGHLINNTDRLPEHDFLDSFHVDSGVYLANAVFSLHNCCLGAFTPYVGAGVGATRLSLSHASSLQTSPPEAGINHFNSKRSDSSWAFAAQIKAGLRYTICESFHIFGEYRYLFVDSSNYILGSTVYPSHAATSPWNVKVKDIQYNAFVFGLQYDL